MDAGDGAVQEGAPDDNVTRYSLAGYVMHPRRLSHNALITYSFYREMAAETTAFA